MNKHKILIAFFGAALAFASCKKSDLQSEALSQTKNAASVSGQWKTLNDWSSQSETEYTIYSNSVTDQNVTASIASTGLVLAYKKSGNTTVALPSEEQATGGSYLWYYQISDGNITFSADAYGKVTKPGADLSFAYFIVSPEKLKDLETNGYSKAQLMTLSYENAAQLLK